jgi:hypothetical protein
MGTAVAEEMSAGRRGAKVKGSDALRIHLPDRTSEFVTSTLQAILTGAARGTRGLGDIPAKNVQYAVEVRGSARWGCADDGIVQRVPVTSARRRAPTSSSSSERNSVVAYSCTHLTARAPRLSRIIDIMSPNLYAFISRAL